MFFVDVDPKQVANVENGFAQSVLQSLVASLLKGHGLCFFPDRFFLVPVPLGGGELIVFDGSNDPPKKRVQITRFVNAVVERVFNEFEPFANGLRSRGAHGARIEEHHAIVEQAQWASIMRDEVARLGRNVKTKTLVFGQAGQHDDRVNGAVGGVLFRAAHLFELRGQVIIIEPGKHVDFAYMLEFDDRAVLVVFAVEVEPNIHGASRSKKRLLLLDAVEVERFSNDILHERRENFGVRKRLLERGAVPERDDLDHDSRVSSRSSQGKTFVAQGRARPAKVPGTFAHNALLTLSHTATYPPLVRAPLAPLIPLTLALFTTPVAHAEPPAPPAIAVAASPELDLGPRWSVSLGAGLAAGAFLDSSLSRQLANAGFDSKGPGFSLHMPLEFDTRVTSWLALGAALDMQFGSISGGSYQEPHGFHSLNALVLVRPSWQSITPGRTDGGLVGIDFAAGGGTALWEVHDEIEAAPAYRLRTNLVVSYVRRDIGVGFRIGVQYGAAGPFGPRQLHVREWSSFIEPRLEWRW